jgi:Mitochondrial calcium uniporter
VLTLDDVLRLKYTIEGVPYVRINGNAIIMPALTSLRDLKIQMMKALKLFSIEVLSQDGFPYHDMTPLQVITEGSFCFVMNHTDHYMVIQFKEDDVFDNENNRIRDQKMQEFMASFGSTVSKRAILSKFVNHIVDEILKVKSKETGKINAYALRKIIENKIQKDCLRIKSEVETVDKLLSVLQEKKQLLEEIKSQVHESILKRSQRRLKVLYSLIFAQVLFTQYGTYVKYSWDVMEPITCLMGITDMILAYVFWMMNNSSFSLEAFEQNFIESKTKSRLGGKFNVLEEMEDVEATINHLELWKRLHSDSLPQILEALDTKFKELN